MRARRVIRKSEDFATEYVQNYREALSKVFYHQANRYIVDCGNFGELLDEGQSWYLCDMELCSVSLTDFIRSDGNVFDVERDTRRIMWQITSGIEFIHGCNWVHRGVRPNNGT